METHHLRFTDGGRERLHEVLAFLDELDRSEHPIARQARSEFEERLRYLDEFGGAVSDDDPRRRFSVTLGRDWAPMSFAVSWARLDRQTGEYLHSFAGGLIWHGGGNDPLCVSLTPTLWGVHT